MISRAGNFILIMAVAYAGSFVNICASSYRLASDSDCVTLSGTDRIKDKQDGKREKNSGERIAEHASVKNKSTSQVNKKNNKQEWCKWLRTQCTRVRTAITSANKLAMGGLTIAVIGTGVLLKTTAGSKTKSEYTGDGSEGPKEAPVDGEEGGSKSDIDEALAELQCTRAMLLREAQELIDKEKRARADWEVQIREAEAAAREQLRRQTEEATRAWEEQERERQALFSQ